MHGIPLILGICFLLFAGCGGGERGAGEGGTVVIDGSSTVYPITEAVAEEFMLENPGMRVTVGSSGTGGGFSKFVRRETDINDASRPIKPSEVTLAQQNDIQYIELPVAYDGIALVVNPENDWVDCLTVEELERIWAPGSSITNWNQVRPEFPNQPINLYGPGVDSGTYDYFTEAVVGEEGASRTDFTASEDDNVLVQGVQGGVGALGFIPLAYYEENQNRLKLLGVDDGDGECVQPTAETVRTGTYQPLSRPVFIYVRADQADDPAVQAFVEYYLETVPQLAPEVGYIPLPEGIYDLAMERFEQGTTGSIFEGGGSQVGVSLEDLLRREGTGAAAADTTAL